MAKLKRAHRDSLAFEAFKASLGWQQTHLGRYGLLTEESYWDSRSDVREHWLKVVDAVVAQYATLTSKETRQP